MSFFQEAGQIDDEQSFLWELQAQRLLSSEEQERLNQLDDVARELLARARAAGFEI